MFRGATNVLSKTCGVVSRSTQIDDPKIKQLILIQTRCKWEAKDGEECVPKARKRSRKLLTAATIAAVGTTIAVVAAKNDEDFRDWAKVNSPLLDKVVKVIYREEETYLEFLARAHKQLSDWIKDTLYNAFEQVKRTGEPTEKKPIKGSSTDNTYEEAKKSYIPPESAFTVKENDDTSVGKARVKPPTELRQLESTLANTAKDVIQSYYHVINLLRDRAKQLDNLDQLIARNDSKIWENLRKKKEEEKKTMDKAANGHATLEPTAEKLKSALDNMDSLPVEMKTKAKQNIAVLLADVDKAKEAMENEKKKNAFTKCSPDKVRKARKYFTEELETLFPNVLLNDEKLNLPPDNQEPFIRNIIIKIEYLQNDLAKLETVDDAEVTAAIQRLKLYDDPEGVIAAIIPLEASKEKRLHQDEMQKDLLTYQAKCEKNGRAALKQQAEVYADLKAEAISVKEREVERKMAQRLDEKLAQLREDHKIEIAKMVGRIKGANAAISGRGEVDKNKQEKQQFWSAAQSLLSAVKPLGLPTSQNKPKPLKNEIANVSKAAPKDDELVSLALESIPQQAVEKGVESEQALRERFLTVVKEARKVAAVPDGPVSILRLILSRVQSALYMNEPIPQAELNNEPINVEDLNNYEVLVRAKFYVDKGEFDQAIRYLNLLKGPSGKVAGDWVRDAIVHLETKQAVEALFAHATAIGQT